MPLTSFDHVNIRTAQLARMIAWYEEILGLLSGPRPDFGFPGAWLYLGDQALIHLVEIDEELSGGGDITLEHIAFQARDLDAFLAKLKVENIPHRIGRIDSIGMTQINIWDPDGNHIHVDFRDD